MSTQQLRTAVGAAKEPKTFMELIEVMKPEIARALPRHINPERMTRIAITEYRRNPKLGECEIRSVFGAIITLSQLGLEPGVMGQAYLIPYNGTATAVPGWQGLADLVARAGRASVWTGAVFEGDEFEYAFGDRPHIEHRPNEDGEEAPGPEKLTHVYAVGRIKGAEWPVIEVWSKAKVTKHRDRFNKVGNKHYSFQHFEMYARKVVLLQVIKYMPKSVELQNAVDLSAAAEAGVTIDLKQAASGWVPSAPEEPPPGGTTGTSDATGDATTSVPSVEEACKTIRLTKTLKENEQVYEGIRNAYQAATKELPIEIDGAYTDHKAVLEQKL
jgi:recombination protein RecT